MAECLSTSHRPSSNVVKKADIKALIDFSAAHGVNFNRADFTLFSDRGTALLSVAESSLPLTFKYLCCKHLERNLKSNGFSSIVLQFQRAVHTHSAREFQRV